MPWCFSTSASAATVLNMHPCVSGCLEVKSNLSGEQSGQANYKEETTQVVTETWKMLKKIIVITVPADGQAPLGAKTSADTLTHCGLVTPYGSRDLGQHWFR